MKISALDEKGKPVDWWFMYKVPKLTLDANSQSAVGYEYIYYDSNGGNVEKSPNLLTDEKGALNFTLNSFFNKPDADTGWILYNDEQPADVTKKDSSDYGHNKGVLAFNTTSKTALWLLHSWPKFSDSHKSIKPTPIYGQTFLCVSLDIATANKIADQMTNHQVPQVYEPRIPANLSKKDALYLLSQPLNPNPVGDSNFIDCKSIGGLPFKVIAKNRKWNKDFWNDLVGPTLKEDMDVETWIRGKIPPVLDSDGIHKTFDVKYIDLSHLDVPYAWPETHDHAKWGISMESNWICVGDINRMVSQEKRGGGTIAFQNKELWSALKKTELLVAPPGHSRVDAKALIKKTHEPEHQPNLKKVVAKKSAPKKSTVKKAVTKKAVKKAVTKKAK